MPFNQRFVAAINLIQEHGLIRFEKDLMTQMGWKRGRLTYLKSSEAKGFNATEADQLAELYPLINWKHVNSGEGKMLAAQNMVSEPKEAYGNNEWKKEELKRIVAGTSTTPIEEREGLLIAELQRLQQIIIEAQAINNSTLLQDLKNLIKGKS